MTCEKLLSINCQELVGTYAYLEKSIDYLQFNIEHDQVMEFNIVDRKIKNINIIEKVLHVQNNEKVK